MRLDLRQDPGCELLPTWGCVSHSWCLTSCGYESTIWTMVNKTGEKSNLIKKKWFPEFLAFLMKPERHMNLYINIFLCLKNIPGHHPPQQRLSGKRPCSYLHSMNQWRIWSWRFSLMSGPSVSFRSSLIVTKASLYSSSCFICTLFLRWDSLSAWIIAALTSFNKGGGFWKYRPKGLRSWRLRCWWKILETNETCQYLQQCLTQGP